MNLRGMMRGLPGTARDEREPAAALPMPGDGWRSWCGDCDAQQFGMGNPAPYDFLAVEIMRPEWREPQTVGPRTLPPAMNVSGLWWRPL